MQTRKVAFIGDYPPRQCGIATFTSDLCLAVATQYQDVQWSVASVSDLDGSYAYPSEVQFEIEEQNLASYERAADFLNINNFDVVCVQHEFGIYGGPAGGHLLALLRDLNMAVVTTFHTLLEEPNPEQRRVMRELTQLSNRLVVMTRRGERILRDVYSASPKQIDLIPHGIPDMPFVDPNLYKDQFGLEGKLVLLTFGLLSPSKGIENVLKALPEIVAEFPDVVYMVLGATHPHLVREQGEAYRLSLELLAEDLDVQKNVIFYNRFVELEELKEFIAAADVYVTPYLNEAQIVSGTLAYAFGSGKAVVSTPYWHAEELLAENRGVLVPFNNAGAIAHEVSALLRDDLRRHALCKNAYIQGREMVWSNVAHHYLHSFERARVDRSRWSRKLFATKTLDQRLSQLPELKLDHLSRMTDSTGLLQHALFSVPNFSHGYCTDDNARALVLTLLLEEQGQELPKVRSLATVYAAFLSHAFDADSKRFRNFMGYERLWQEEMGSEDCHGRALWALGTCVGRSCSAAYQALAGQLFTQALPAVTSFSSPRAWAFSLLGIHEYLRRLSGDRLANQIREILTSRLTDIFRRSSRDDWPWFEEVLSYDNAHLPHALILSGRWTEQPEVFETGLKTLRWLATLQMGKTGYFQPIGSDGFYHREGPRAQFDQQPLEAQAMISACLEAYRSTGDHYWFAQACRAFEWFLGRNDLGSMLYDTNTGGCCDGLHMDRVNQNQGAESTLAFLLSLMEMRLMQNTLRTFKEPVLADSEKTVIPGPLPTS